MAETLNRVIADVALVEVQQTAALRAVSANLDVADDASWIDISTCVQGLMPGAPANKAVTEEFNASQSAAMVSISNRVAPWTPQLTVYEKNGAVEDLGVTNDLNIYEDILEPALDNGIVLPMRYSIRGTTGDPLYTYAAMRLLGIAPPEIKPGNAVSAVQVVSCHSTTRTRAVVA